MEEESYQGIPLEEVQINSLDWKHRAEHIRTRSERMPGDFDVEPAWATEAALDPKRIVRTTQGLSLKVVGHSPSAPPREEGEIGRVIKVWIVPKDLELGDWWGATACEGNSRDRRQYEEVE